MKSINHGKSLNSGSGELMRARKILTVENRQLVSWRFSLPCAKSAREIYQRQEYQSVRRRKASREWLAVSKGRHYFSAMIGTLEIKQMSRTEKSKKLG